MSEEKKPIGFNCNHCHDDYDDVQESYQSVDGTICSVCYDELCVLFVFVCVSGLGFWVSGLFSVLHVVCICCPVFLC